MAESGAVFPAVGDVVAGRFRIVGTLGAGAWTSIFKAYQSDLDRFVALKIMHPDSAADPTLVERFRREALFASQLTHPNTITTYDYGETGQGSFYIAMELLDGEDLLSLVRREGALEPERACALMVQICRSLAEVHALGMVHRDLKPDNIMVCRRPGSGDDAPLDFIKVLDFGIAKATQAIGGDDKVVSRLTRTGRVVGTPLYMSPEQLMEEPASASSDVYALGHILFELLSGQAAFDQPGASSMETMMRHLEDEVPDLPSPMHLHPLQIVIRRATHKQPQDRYASAQAMLGALEAARLLGTTPPGALQTPLPTLGESVRRALPGRQHEVAWLAEHLRQVQRFEHSRLLVLEGAAGIGKSAVLRTFLEQVVERADEPIFLLARHRHPAREIREGGLWADVCILLGLEDAGERSLSIQLREALRSYSTIQESHIPLLLRLLRRDPEIHATLQELQVQRQRLFEALSKPFLGLARQQLFVWALEDLQGEDPLTLAFLDYLRLRFEERDCRLLVVAASCREQIAHGSIGARNLRPLLSAGPPEVYELRLRGLPEAVSAEVLREVLDAPVGVELAASIRRVTQGHPQHMRELLQSLHRQGALRQTNEVWQLLPSAPPNLVAPQLADVIAQRLQAAEDSGAGGRLVSLLETVALLADDVKQEECARFAQSIGARCAGEVEEAVQDAASRGWLHASEGALRFDVPLAREVLLKRLFDDAREAGHFGERARASLQAAARWLERRSSEPTGPELRQIIRRYVAAGDRAGAVRVLRQAADVAYRSFNLETALDYYLRALRLGREAQDASADPGEALIVLLRLGEIYGTLGDLALAEDHLREAQALAEAPPVSPLKRRIQGRALQLEGELALQRGDLSAAQRGLEAAREIWLEIGDDHGVARVITELAHVRILQGDPAAALDPLLEALVLAELIGLVSLQARARLYLSRVRQQLGLLEQAAADARAALRLSTQEENLAYAAHAQVELGQTLLLQGELEGACVALERAVERKRLVRDRDGLRRAHRLLAAALAAQGATAAARDQVHQEIQLAEEQQDALGAAWSSLLSVDLELHALREADGTAADPRAVEAWINALVRLGAELEQPVIVALAEVRRVLLELLRRPEAAQAHLRGLLQRASGGDQAIGFLLLDGLCAAHQGRPAEALQRLYEVTPRVPQAGHGLQLFAHLVSARTLLFLGRPGDAQPHVERGWHLALQQRATLEAASFNLLQRFIDAAQGQGVAPSARALGLNAVLSVGAPR